MSQELIKMINDIFQICIVPLFGILTTFFVKYINRKSEQIETSTNNVIVKQHVELAKNTIINAVIATNQTYVEQMKQQNIFDTKAQKEAFEMTKKAVLASLSESAKDILGCVYNDFDAWLNTAIEAVVNEVKDGKVVVNK